MANIKVFEDYRYKHFNNAMGIKIESKEHYKYEMKRRGLIPQEEADEKARIYNEKKNNVPKAKFSEKALSIINAAKCRADKKGNVKLGDRTIEAMKELGVAIGHKYMPRGRDVNKGGFC